MTVRRVFVIALAVQIGVAAAALAAPGCCRDTAIPAAGLGGYLALAALTRWRPLSMLLGLGVYSAAAVHGALFGTMLRGGLCTPCAIAAAGAGTMLVAFPWAHPRAARRAAWSLPLLALPVIAAFTVDPPPAPRAIGNPSAPLAVLFTSPSCPACREFDARVWPILVREFVESGRLRVERRYAVEPFDLHGRELAARELATRLPGASANERRALVAQDRRFADAMRISDLPTLVVGSRRLTSSQISPSAVESLLIHEPPGTQR